MSVLPRSGLAVLSIVVLLGGGCLTQAPPTVPNVDGASVALSTAGPGSVETGQTVSLTAKLDGAEPGSVEIEWYQTFGRVVALSGKTGLQVSFVAPPLGNAQTLRFRADVRGPDGVIGSSTVEVVVQASPGFVATPASTSDGSDPTVGDPSPNVRILTSKGEIRVELDRVRAPQSVANFLQYVDDGFYTGTIFHRVIADFVVQGGGFDIDLLQKDTRPPIKNESDNGLKNDRGTIAMARTNDPDSATSQFYINLVDNDSLNPQPNRAGYAVFGRVVEGMEIVDAIAAAETGSQNGMSDVPTESILNFGIERVP